MLTNSNFYIGDSSVSRLYQGDNLVWDASHPDILLEYIANGPDSGSNSTKNVYFDTTVIADANTRCDPGDHSHRGVSGSGQLSVNC
jgi:hypothetical protein